MLGLSIFIILEFKSICDAILSSVEILDLNFFLLVVFG